jgi:putative alpha-1,2-mannosidase
MSGFLRAGKEIPFDKIGETKKAPVQNANTIAWDVLRSKHPLFRVVASGADGKANNVMIFVVKRPGLER